MDCSIFKDDNNSEKVAIICVGYNRLNGLKRLIDSLQQANYPCENIPLIISIDCSGDEELYKYVRDIVWPFGKKYVNIENKRLGLKKHILQCGDLSEYFKAVIILEDDLYVSPSFYDYTIEVINSYKESDIIAGFSLYAPELNGFVGLPFTPLQNGSDVYLAQDAPTWGECFTYAQWRKFKKWYTNFKEEDILATNMPNQIKLWNKAWSKYFYTYVVNNNKYFIYPYNSYTTNFSDAGVHGLGSNDVQVSLLLKKRRALICLEEDNLIRYDVYQNNEYLYDILNLSKDEVTIDLYANTYPFDKKKYLLTTRILNFKIIKSYGLRFRPIELNIIQDISGDDIYLYNTSIKEKNYRHNNYVLTDYYLKGFNKKILLNYATYIVSNKIKTKLKSIYKKCGIN